MKYKLQDLIDMEQFQHLQDRLNEIYAFPSAIVDNEGNILTATAWQDVCTQFHRKHPDCERECRLSDQYIQSHLPEANPAVSYRCPHGLVDNATPIIIDGVHYANFFTGQFFLEKPDLEFFRVQARKYGFDEEAYLKAVAKVPVWTRGQLNSYLFFIKGLIAVISESGLKKLKETEARKRVEESERRFQVLFEQATVGVAQIRSDTGRFERINRKYCDIVGYSREEMEELDFQRITHPDDLAGDLANMELLKAGKIREFAMEKRYFRKDGSPVWVNLTVSPLWPPGEPPSSHVAVVEDITERKAHETEIERLNHLYLALSQVNQLITRVKTREELLGGVCQMLVQYGQLKLAWIGRLDPPTRAVIPVAQHGDTGGYLPQVEVRADASSLGLGPTGTAIREERTVVCNDFAHTMATTPWQAAAARQSFGSSCAFPIREQGRVCGALTVYAGEPGFFRDKEVRLFEEAALDVSFALDQLETERQKQWAEAALRTSEEQFRETFYRAGVGKAQADPWTGRFLRVNPAFCAFLGYTEAELLRKTFLEITLPEERAADTELYGRLLRGDIATYTREKRYIRKDGTLVWGHLSPTMLFDTNGRASLVSAVIQDITERKGAEEALRTSEARLNEAQRIARLGNWERDHQTHRLLWSEETFRIFEIAHESALASDGAFLAAIHPEDRDAVKAAYARSLETHQPYSITHRLLMPDGRIKFVREQCQTDYHPDGKPLRSVGIVQDVTERKLAEQEKARLEAQYQQAQKMESVGQLAGGIAHDFNNILAAIMMQLGFLRGNPSLDAETRELLQEVLAGARRASGLTRQLLVFSRRSVLEVKVLDLNEVVANLLQMLARLIGEHITVRFDRRRGLPAVEADAGMMEQVLMNLALNARDAMPQGGILTFGIEPIDVDAERVKGHPGMPPGLFVCLSVADTGCGMSAATLQRVFEPFFTTKEPGKGTGLGLATVYGIAAQHKGWVEVASELGKGTTFRVFLPATTEGIVEPTPPGQPATLRGHETILLVEDEAILRRMVTQVLRGLGYQVREAGNGREAITLWREHAGRIDLLISDMVMPEGMTGLDLAEKLRMEKPGLKVIISSGYNVEMAGARRPTAGGITYLQKPYDAEGLSKTIRDCLERS